MTAARECDARCATPSETASHFVLDLDDETCDTAQIRFGQIAERLWRMWHLVHYFTLPRSTQRLANQSNQLHPFELITVLDDTPIKLV